MHLPLISSSPQYSSFLGLELKLIELYIEAQIFLAPLSHEHLLYDKHSLCDNESIYDKRSPPRQESANAVRERYALLRASKHREGMKDDRSIGPTWRVTSPRIAGRPEYSPQMQKCSDHPK